MNVFQGFILGIIQGLTEFLPISSSGHLVLFQRLFGLEEGALTFDVALHFATLVAVVWVFRDDVLAMIKKPFSKMTLLVVVGTLPTVIIALLFKDIFDKLFESGITLGFEFLITGAILWVAESIRGKDKRLEKVNYTDAAIIGVAQGIAILPAISRSGLTLAGALMRGLNREFALKLSFLMSIPSILGATVLHAKDIIKPDAASAAATNVEMMPLIVGMVAAAVSGYFAVRFMLKVFSKASLKVFSYYVFALGIFIILEQLISGKIFGSLF